MFNSQTFLFYVYLFMVFNILETVNFHSCIFILPIFLRFIQFFLIQLYLEFLENSITHFHQLRTQILTRILCSIFIFAKVLVWHLYHRVAYTYSYHLPVKMAFLVSITSAGRMKFRLDSKPLYGFFSLSLILSLPHPPFSFFFFNKVILESQYLGWFGRGNLTLFLQKVGYLYYFLIFF